MRALIRAFMATILLSSCAAAKNEPVLGGPCEGCDYVFVQIPKVIDWSSRIAPPKEKGEAMVLEGSVRDTSGTPAAGIIVYAYHTDAGGRYPRGTTRHGSLRGWACTDSKGRYRFETIRPGAYPQTDNPQHIHLHVIEPGRGTYYIDDVVFDDDPLLTDENRPFFRHGRGGFGECHPVRDAKGVWQVQRDVILGANIPGYGR